MSKIPKAPSNFRLPKQLGPLVLPGGKKIKPLVEEPPEGDTVTIKLNRKDLSSINNNSELASYGTPIGAYAFELPDKVGNSSGYSTGRKLQESGTNSKSL